MEASGLPSLGAGLGFLCNHWALEGRAEHQGELGLYEEEERKF